MLFPSKKNGASLDAPFFLLYYFHMIEIIDTTLEQEVRLFVNYISDDQKKADEVVMRYGWLAEYVTLKFSKLGVDTDALYNAGIDALLTSAAEYRLGSCGRFALFALDYVVDGVRTLIQDEYATKHIDGLSSAIFRAKNAAVSISNNVNNDSTDWHVANALGIDESDLSDILYGSPIITKDNIENTSRQTADTIKRSSSSASISFLRKAFKRFDDIIENYENEDK